ncbi:MAG: PIN domain-containing protein [bacterium]
MILIDTSGWIEYFNNPDHKIIKDIDYGLDNELICLGDLIYCEFLQGVKHKKELMRVKDVFNTLYKERIGGFDICEKAAQNYRFLRSIGITVRKTIDVIIGTFCIEKGYEIIHNDNDFIYMEKNLGLISFKKQADNSF